MRHYQTLHPAVFETLKYYDAATATRLIQQPLHVAAALFDPAVAPLGQFAIYNALPEPKKLFVLEAEHFNYPQQSIQKTALYAELTTFFAAM